ncbi:MAG TPA: hypothetical protein VK776_03685 [Bryobacteraceae bacterium]|jgi:hypothetical protein|nr:hypothetical protein [Bryobacteraceae bacterium]
MDRLDSADHHLAHAVQYLSHTLGGQLPGFIVVDGDLRDKTLGIDGESR